MTSETAFFRGVGDKVAQVEELRQVLGNLDEQQEGSYVLLRNGSYRDLRLFASSLTDAGDELERCT